MQKILSDLNHFTTKLRQMMSFDDDIKKQALTALKLRFNSIKGGDELAVMDIPPPKWMIPDLIPVGLTILGGPKKLGKSYLVMQFAKQLVEDGYPIFNFAGEDALDLHKERQKHVGLGASDDYQFVAGRTEYFASQENFYDSISEVLKMYPFKVIFIDVMAYCLKPEKVKDYSYYMKELGRWAKLAHHHKIAIFLVTHTGKNAGQTYSNPIDHLIGSTGIGSAADWVLTMLRSDDGQSVKLHSEGKMGKPTTFSVVKKNGIFYEIDGLERDRLLKRKSAQNEIFECIKENSHIKQKEIVEKLNKPKGNISRDIIKLLKQNYITGNSSEGYLAILDNVDNLDN
mgnify:CR=1 FL=1